MLTQTSPADVGLHPQRWEALLQRLQEWSADDRIPASGLLFARQGLTTGVHLFGCQHPSAPEPIRSDAIFLVASITKPVVAMGLLLLVERGELSLDDRVEAFVPEFGRQGKHAVTVRHLLTHTSGLPDMLPNNRELRSANAPLSEFVRLICDTPLDFPAGRGVQYQSTGLAIAGEIVTRITGASCGEFLQSNLFQPLGMTDTVLGAPDAWFEGKNPVADRIATVRIPERERQDPHWDWNSRYWRQFGAPWGGLLTTPADLARFAQLMLNEGQFEDQRIFSPATIRAATRNQLEHLRDVPADDRRCRPWGLGWRLNWPGHSANFGDLLGPRTFGHWGATGTVLWIDPDQQAFCVLLTTQPQEPHGKELARATNMVVAALC